MTTEGVDMSASEWIWMPHAAHLCVSDRCHFRLATYIPPSLNVHNGVIVSTVGEYTPSYQKEFETVGRDRLYETMVFKAIPTTADDCAACPYRCDVEGGEIDFDGYNSAQAAYKGHLALCRKWASL